MRSFDFGWAMAAVKSGKRIFRPEWGPGVYVMAQFPDTHSKMSVPYLYKVTASNKVVPYEPNNIDIFAEDWDCV